MKKSKKTILILSVFQTFATSEICASTSTNPFDLIDEPEMLKIQEDCRFNQKRRRRELINFVLQTAFKNPIHPTLMKKVNSYSEDSFIGILMKVYLSNTAKATYNIESINSYNMCRNMLQKSYDQGTLSEDEATIAFALMPDASLNDLLNAKPFLLKQGFNEANIAQMIVNYVASPFATLEEILVGTKEIIALGKEYNEEVRSDFAIKAFQLFLHYLYKNEATLTVDQNKFAKEAIKKIAKDTREFLALANLILNYNANETSYIKEIIRTGVSNPDLSIEQLEEALSFVQSTFLLDQKLQHEIVKKIGSRRLTF
jgi:hypothetical protein